MQRSVFPVLIVVAALAAGCSTAPVLSAGDASAPEVAGSSSLPPGASLRSQDSLVMGSGDAWVGRLVANVGSDGAAAYRHFLETWPAQGWTLLSTVRGKSSLLVFTRQDRTATIELAEGGVGSGTVATITVAPRAAQPVQAGAASGGSAGTAAAAAGGAAPRRAP